MRLGTGRADPHPAPLSAALFGGEDVGDDLGYGHSRLLTPDRVRAVAAALESLDEAELRARADPATMERAELYPGIWGEEEELFDLMLLPSFQDLRHFYAEAPRQGQVVVHGPSLTRGGQRGRDATEAPLPGGERRLRVTTGQVR